MKTHRSRVRQLLDGLYFLAGALAAVCLFVLFVTIMVQMVARAVGENFPGSTDYAGYLMAATSFLAFAYTLNKDGHVRVNLLLGRLKGSRRFLLSLLCHAMASVLTIALAWHATTMVYWSYALGDVSQGQDASLLWIVQIPVAVGAIILALCFVDNLVSMVLLRHDNIVRDTTGVPAE